MNVFEAVSSYTYVKNFFKIYNMGGITGEWRMCLLDFPKYCQITLQSNNTSLHSI